MKSRTSFFDKSVLRKDITRFAPLWGIYLIGGLLIALTTSMGEESSYSVAALLSDTIGIFSIISLCYAILAAQLLFGDLFNTRLCNALHAMPLRREGWFFTHAAAGLLFSLVPNAIISLAVMVNAGRFWYTALLWLLGMELHYIFFFGLAVFCMMLTGNRFAAAAVYTIVNFFSMIAMWFATTVFAPVLYGVVIRTAPFAPFCPVVNLCGKGAFFAVVHSKSCPCFYDGNPYQYRVEQHDYVFGGLSADWWYLVILAVLGIVLGAAALVLYRKRHLERAGDFMAFKAVNPLFSLVYTLCVGAVLQVMGNLFEDPMYIFMVIGLIVGFFTSQMLLSRSLKVFKIKNWLYAALILLLVFGSIGLCKIDTFGLVRWLPDAEDVAEIKIADSRVDTFKDYNTDAQLSDPQSIKKLIAIHDLLAAEGPVEDRTSTSSGLMNVTICYTLKDGREVYRQYRADRGGDGAAALNAMIFNNPTHVLKAVSLEDLCSKVTEVLVENIRFTGEKAKSFLTALWADAEAGTLPGGDAGKAETVEYVGVISLSYQDGRSYYFDLFSSNVNTYKWIKEELLTDISAPDLINNISHFLIDGICLDWESPQELQIFCTLFSQANQDGLVTQGKLPTGCQVQLQLAGGLTMDYTVTEKAADCFNWIIDFLAAAKPAGK